MLPLKERCMFTPYGNFTAIYWGKSNIRSVSAPCLLLLNSKASYSQNLYGHNTGHQRPQTHANMAIGQYTLRPQFECSIKN